jgi:hypothetical protein
VANCEQKHLERVFGIVLALNNIVAQVSISQEVIMRGILCLIVLTLLQSGIASRSEESDQPKNTGADADAAIESAGSTSPISLCVDSDGCKKPNTRVIHGNEIGSEKGAPVLAGHPLTSVVVTQCNLVVAVYMTMADGRFLRFDQKSDVTAEQLVTIAYSATHSERIEVSCEGTGLVAYEKHEPI